MKIRRLISALLFALTLAALALACGWYALMTVADKTVRSALESKFGGQVTFSAVKWRPDPKQLRLTLENVSLSFKNGPYHYKHTLGDADILQDFVGGFKLKIILPRQQSVEIKEATNNTITRYNLLMERGQASFFANGKKTTEADLAFTTLVVKQGNQVAARAGDTYLLGDITGFGTTRFFTKNFKLEGFDRTEPLHLKAFHMEFDGKRLPDFAEKLLLPILAETTVSTFDSHLKTLSQQAMAKKSTLNISDIRLALPDNTWVAIQGKAEVNNMTHLNSAFTLSTNRFDRVTQWLEKRPDFPVSVLNDRRFKNLLGKTEDATTFNTETRNGTLYLNGLHAGPMEPLPAFIDSLAQ